MRKNLAVAVAAVLVALVAAGCGGGSNKLKAAEFADKTCTDLAAWARTLTDVFGDLQAISSSTPSDETEAKNALRKLSAALGNLDSATAKLANSINSRNAPDVQSGDQIKKTLVDALNAFRASARKARVAVDNFDVTNASSDDIDSFSSAMDSFGSGADKNFSSLDAFSDNSQLDSAFSDSKTCDDLQSQFSSFSS